MSIGAKLDRIIELLEQMAQAEDEQSDDLHCPNCGSSEDLETYDVDGGLKAICCACDHRFAVTQINDRFVVDASGGRRVA